MFVFAAYVHSAYDESLQSIQRAMTYYVCNIRKIIRRRRNNEALRGSFEDRDRDCDSPEAILHLADAVEMPEIIDPTVNVEFL